MLLAEIITPDPNVDFDSLELPFTHEEFDNIVKDMPPDKSPGPDGFNGTFLKKCWNNVKDLFYRLCADFYDGRIPLDSINTANITLIPKHNSPESITDYRTISLVSLALKFLTKLLANRL